MIKINKKLKFLIIDEYYLGFLKSFRRKNPGLASKPFVEQRKAFIDQCFGTSDFYSFNLKKIGCKVEEIIVNDEILQRTWAREHGLKVSESNILSKIQLLPVLHRYLGRPKWIQEIVLEQIKFYKPDVLYVHNLSILNPETLKRAKLITNLIVGQIATTLPAKKNLSMFDLIITSFPHFVQKFRKMGIKSEYLKIAFEQRILSKFRSYKRIYDVSFVGSFGPHHRKGTKLFEEVARQLPIHVWGQGIRFVSTNSSLREYYHGEAWGLKMYKILAQSKIVINRHISVAGDYANNMRLYEATGMGALLITDYKRNLDDIFKVGKEVVEYKTVDELVEKIRYYLEHENERARIAASGQKKTLRKHSYLLRMKELIKILNKYL